VDTASAPGDVAIEVERTTFNYFSHDCLPSWRNENPRGSRDNLGCRGYG
jgi:hypothetical protein